MDAAAAIRILRSIRSQYAANGVVPANVVVSYERCRAAIQNKLGLDLHHLTPRSMASATGAVFVVALYPAIDEILAVVEPELEDQSTATVLLDDDLRKRCSDLLAANDHFDRAISQATVVLEDRLRKMTGSPKDLVGVPLVNRTINGDPTRSKLIYSDVPGEQQGFADLVRGTVAIFRNQAHHHLDPSVSRQRAWTICLLVDELLAQMVRCKLSD